jgi:hypothetical protein
MMPDEIVAAVRATVRDVVTDSALRRTRVAKMTELFDGRGAERIITALCG